MRLSCSVLDSTADLTFDPVSARFSTGTQPRSVILKNQNNKALDSGNEANDTLFMLCRLIYKSSVFLYGCSAYFKKHTQSSACIIAINVDGEKKNRHRDTDSISAV